MKLCRETAQHVDEGVGDNLVRSNYNVATQVGNVTNARGFALRGTNGTGRADN